MFSVLSILELDQVLQVYFQVWTQVLFGNWHNSLAPRSPKTILGITDESLDELDQEDPKLVEAVRSRIIVPETEAPYNLPSKDDDHIEMSGQFNQVFELRRVLASILLPT